MTSFKYEICPICNEKNLFSYEKTTIYCKNNCYIHSHSISILPPIVYINISIFKDKWEFTKEDTIENNKIKENINKLINYWREDDRYIGEILANERELF